MPVIRPSADLRNKYSDISDFCHKFPEPVFITKNGQGDLVVMSIETYEAIVGRKELHMLLNEGIAAIEAGQTRPATEVISELRAKLKT